MTGIFEAVARRSLEIRAKKASERAGHIIVAPVWEQREPEANRALCFAVADIIESYLAELEARGFKPLPTRATDHMCENASGSSFYSIYASMLLYAPPAPGSEKENAT